MGNPDNYLLLLGQFSYLGQRPKAQHVILGLYPYIYNMKITWFFILFSLYNFGFLPSHFVVAPMRFFILFLGEKEGSICDVKFQWLFAYLPVGVSWNRQGINKIERHFEKKLQEWCYSYYKFYSIYLLNWCANWLLDTTQKIILKIYTKNNFKNLFILLIWQ